MLRFSLRMLPFFLESSKTDQFCDGAWIVIASSDLSTCPVKALIEYISAAHMNLSEDLPLFRALDTPRSNEMTRSQGISYTRARELVNYAFRGLTDVSKLSLHSLRARRATSAANTGTPDRLFKRHGRWASKNAMDAYAKDDFNSRLLISRSLGIQIICTVEPRYNELRYNEDPLITNNI